MNTQADLNRCQAFINCQLHPGRSPVIAANTGTQWRAVTISRQSGSGGHVVAERLAEYLHAHAPKGMRPWMVFDQNLVDAVLQDHHLPGRLAKFIPEDRIPAIEDSLEELLGLHPPAETLIRGTAETILHLVELGNVILIGRGANVITARRDDVFHVRLVGSLDRRAEYIQKLRQLGRKTALELIRVEDRGRQRYLKKYFGENIDDPLLYHLVINTDFVGHEGAAQLIGETALSQPFTGLAGRAAAEASKLVH